jgi:hypothetical protein
MNGNGLTLRELVYDLLDEGRRAGDFPLARDSIDLIAAGMIDTLNDREDFAGPFDQMRWPIWSTIGSTPGASISSGRDPALEPARCHDGRRRAAPGRRTAIRQ